MQNILLHTIYSVCPYLENLVLPDTDNIDRFILEYDGVFLSNGPGDPSICGETITNINKALQKGNKPVFGICLGHQLLSRAAGCTTYKLP